MSPTFSGESVTFGDIINDIIVTHERATTQSETTNTDDE
jgi:hypothetical protein